MRTWLPSAIVLLVMSGCTSSENGLCPPDSDQAVFDPALLGVWNPAPRSDAENQARHTNQIGTSTVAIGPPTIALGPPQVTLGAPDGAGQPIRVEQLKEGSKTYRITDGSPPAAPGGAAPTEEFLGTLVAIGTSRFLDVTVAQPKPGQERRHLFLKVEAGPNTLAIRVMNPGYLTSHPDALAHRQEGGPGPIPIAMDVITASSPAIRAFFEQHERDPDLWPEGTMVRYVRPAPAKAAHLTEPGTPRTP